MSFDDIVRKLKGIEGWMGIPDCQVLYKYASRLNGATIVEVGSYAGRSTLVLSLASPTSTVYAIDPFKKDLPEDYRKVLKHFRQNIKGLNVVHFRKTSLSVALHWDKPIDLIHIDGEHSYKSVKRDIKMWMPFVKKGGVMLFHDYEARQFGVRDAVNKFCQNPTQESGFGVVVI